MSHVKVCGLIEKSKNWNEDIWVDSSDSETHQLLSPAEMPSPPSLRVLTIPFHRDPDSLPGPAPLLIYN